MPTIMPTPPMIGKILYRPVRVITWPATTETTIIPSIIGSSSRPLLVADAPCTVCW